MSFDILMAMNIENPTIIVEAGHLYEPEKIFKIIPGARTLTDEVASPEILTGIQIGTQILNSLREAGLNSQRAAFIDDTMLANHPIERSGDLYGDFAIRRSIYQQITSQSYTKAGWTPRVEYRESNVKNRAIELIADLQKAIFQRHDYWLSQDGKKIKYKEGGKTKSITLLGKDGYDYDPNYPSCDVLDLAMYKQKLNDAQVAITVLPHRYKPQQDRVKKLFSLLGEIPQVIIVYFDEKGEISDVDPWSDEVLSLDETIRKSLDK